MWGYVKALPFGWKAALLLLAAVAIVAGARSCITTTNHKTDAGLTAARGEGAATATAEGLTGVLKDAETANKAGAAVAAGGRAAYDVCMRTSDTPENCPAPAAR